MGSDKLNEQIKMYQELAKKDKSIDVAALMMKALEDAHKEGDTISLKEKRWAYLVSLGFPPFGLLFALKFYLSDKEDGTNSALACVALTAASVFVLVLVFKLALSGAGLEPRSLQQFNTQDIMELTQ